MATAIQTRSSKIKLQAYQIPSTLIGKFESYFNLKIDVYLWQADVIAFESAEWLVNPTGCGFEHGVGVSRAIFDAAGSKLKKACEKYLKSHPYLDFTIPFITQAFELKNYQFIAHVASPFAGLKNYNAILEKTFENLFIKAFNEFDCQSIALPFIGTGANQIPLDECITCFTNALLKFGTSSVNGDNLQIHFVNITDDIFVAREMFSKVMQQRKLDFKRQISTVDDKKDLKRELSNESNEANKTIKKKVEEVKQEEEENCVICMDKITNMKKLEKCGHKFCTDCIDQYFNTAKQTCPTCGTVYGITKGTQPVNAVMNVTISTVHLPGYQNINTIVIEYDVPNGIQGPEHPHPGKPYYGTRRVAYLPNNNEGKEVLALLRKAFQNRLIFTIGRSRTTNQDDVVTWNDIHHKTNTTGGPSQFGYPDATYLNRVKEELAAKGIV